MKFTVEVQPITTVWLLNILLLALNQKDNTIAFEPEEGKMLSTFCCVFWLAFGFCNLTLWFWFAVAICTRRPPYHTVPLRSIHPLNCFPLLLLLYMESWKINLLPSRSSLADGIRFSSRISFYLAAFFLQSIFTSLPGPAAEEHPHSMMLPPPSFTVWVWCDFPLLNDRFKWTPGDVQSLRNVFVSISPAYTGSVVLSSWCNVDRITD